MSVNKYRPHVWIIPEDDADRQLANGFVLHEAVDDRVVQVMAPAGGWLEAIDVFERQYLRLLRRFNDGHVVMVIDFDDQEVVRRTQINDRIPPDVKTRVFLVGSKFDPEMLRRALALSLEKIGRQLADDCLKEDLGLWRHPHLEHNSLERRRLVEIVKPILFQHN